MNNPLEIISNIPKDKYKIVFLLFLINGIGTLLPWNMLINSDKYFVDYKLNINATNKNPNIVNYHNKFLSYLGIASKVPNILLQILNMFINAENANFSFRIKCSLVIQILIFLFIISLAIVDSTTWPSVFFWLTMLSAVLINLANGVYQGCIYGLAARFPMTYTNSVTIGMNFSGTIASILMIISIALSPELKIEAILFFSSAVFILFICLIGEFYINKNTFYQFCVSNHSKCKSEIIKNVHNCPACFEKNYPKNKKNECSHLGMAIAKTISYNGHNENNKNTIQSKCGKYLVVFQTIWPILLNLILCYFVSFSLFPAVQARIISKDHLLSEQYFLPVFCFLSFNLFSTVGNFFAQYIQWPGPRYLIIISVARLLFIPYFLYCNYYPEDHNDRTLPVIFERDWMYIIGSVTMAMSSGYLSSLCMMYAPKCVQPNLSATAGMMSALIIILGILIGINMSFIYPYLLKYHF